MPSSTDQTLVVLPKLALCRVWLPFLKARQYFGRNLIHFGSFKVQYNDFIILYDSQSKPPVPSSQSSPYAPSSTDQILTVLSKLELYRVWLPSRNAMPLMVSRWPG